MRAARRSARGGPPQALQMSRRWASTSSCPERVPLGAVTLLAGDPGEGKSTLTCMWAAQLSRGELGQPGVTLFASAEDGVANVIKPRALACEADIDADQVPRAPRRRRVRARPRAPGRPRAARRGGRGARREAADHRPAERAPAARSTRWKDHGIRTALAPLARLADEHGCAVLCVCHLNKSKGGNALYRVGGSIGYVGAARSVLGFGRDPERGRAQQPAAARAREVQLGRARLHAGLRPGDVRGRRRRADRRHDPADLRRGPRGRACRRTAFGAQRP